MLLRSEIAGLTALLLAGTSVLADNVSSAAATGSSENTDTIETVQVIGTRMQAKEAQFNAPSTVSIMSSEDLAHTAVHNVAEALQLLPGINVTNTGNSFFGGIDGASRGEGMFAQVRGMNSEFTLNQINGVDVAQGMPYSREVQLSLLPPSGMQTIVVHKTGGADDQLDFIGGAIDYHTPTAFDFDKDETFSATIGGRAETRAMDYGEDGLGYSGAMDGSVKFGNHNQFGVYGSIYYDKRTFVNSQEAGATAAHSDGQWKFAVTDADGNNPEGYSKAQNLIATGLDIGISSGYTERWGGNMSVDWKISPDSHVYGKMSYAHAFTRQDTTFSQAYSMGVETGSDGAEIGTTGLYQPVLNYVSTRIWYETNPESAALGTAQIGGDTVINRWALAGNVFYSWGKNDRPNHVEISNRPLINDGKGFAYGGTSLITYDSDGFPHASLTDEMYDRLDNLDENPARRSGDVTRQHSSQEKLGVKFDATYDVDSGMFDSVKMGVKHETSWRHVDEIGWEGYSYDGTTAFSDLGLVDGYWSDAYPGKYSWKVPKINQTKLINLFKSTTTDENITSCDHYSLYGACNTQDGSESVSAVYAMATLHLGDVQIIPGVRYEHTGIRNVYWKDEYDTSGDWADGYFTHSNTDYDEVLPSLFLNWRPSDSAIYRASVWTSYTRPAFVQLAAHTTVDQGDDFDTATEGNPNLKPIEAVNFDISGQWFSGLGGYLQLSAFGKELSHYIYNSGTDYVNEDEDTTTHVTTPTNGGDGHSYGVELEFRQKLDALGSWLSGFAVGGNYTHTWTEVDLGKNTDMRSEPIQNAPANVANLQLTYDHAGLQFDVIWHYTGKYVSSYDYLNQGEDWDNLWVQPMQRVDLHVGYDIGWGVRADASVSNLMDDESYRAQVGKQSSALTDIVDTGRTILFTLKYSYN